jgi:hypothetical protein
MLCLGVILSGPAAEQTLERGNSDSSLAHAASMPSWVVPVLRLVSATHVEPTTGIVLSDSGLVLVPGDFAGMGDEIIVLDGGTDIIRNGRPARIERKFTPEGLQVLFVEGLRRTGATFAAGELENESQVLLTAFPPAELIAQGELPLHVPASVVVLRETGRPSISGETRLPNVTGALIDSCGNLAGVSLADDVQTMEVSPSTRYQWKATLLRILEQMQVTPVESPCDAVTSEPAAEPEPLVEEPPAAGPIEAEQIPESEPEAVDEPIETVPDETTPDEESEFAIDILPPIEEEFTPTPKTEGKSKNGGWLWLVAALVFVGLGLAVHRMRRSQRQKPAFGRDTASLSSPATGSAEEEESSWEAPPLDSMLVIRGVFADGREFEDSCAVSAYAINVVIGRGDADLLIQSAAVSRQHASLNGTREELTLSDLGSSNGTSINGVPCLEGEIMFVEPGDILVFGDARCTMEIRPRPATGSQET